MMPSSLLVFDNFRDVCMIVSFQEEDSDIAAMLSIVLQVE
jgi:hypothetical protein